MNSGAQAFGVPDVLKKKSSGGGDAGALVDQQAGIVKSLVVGFKEYTEGQAQVARALGLKDQADLLDSEQKALGGGNVNDADSIEKTLSVTADAQKAIDEKMAEGVTLSAEAKKQIAKALPSYVKGTLHTVKLLPEIKSWGESATSTIKGAGLMDIPKLKKKFGTGMFIVSKLPGYITTAKDSYSSLLAFSKKNEIDTSEAEDLLGDDDF